MKSVGKMLVNLVLASGFYFYSKSPHSPHLEKDDLCNMQVV